MNLLFERKDMLDNGNIGTNFNYQPAGTNLAPTNIQMVKFVVIS